MYLFEINWLMHIADYIFESFLKNAHVFRENKLFDANNQL